MEGRTALDDEAARQVRRAEWLALVESPDRQPVGSAMEFADAASMEQDLKRWAEREYSLLAQ